MYFCYIDEAGCTGNLPSSVTDVQPVFVLCGLIVPQCVLVDLTQDFLALKRAFNPVLAQSVDHDLDIIKHEIKGAEDLRKPIRKNNRNHKRRAIGFLDKTLALLETHRCKIISNIYVKNTAVNFNGFPITCYAYCTGHIQSVHVDRRFHILQERYAKRLKAISYKYSDGPCRKGGIMVFDALEKRGATEFFGASQPRA